MRFAITAIILLTSQTVSSLENGLRLSRQLNLICPEETRCSKDTDKPKYSIYRTTDKNKCEAKCVDYNKVEYHRDDGYTCGRCEDVKPDCIGTEDQGGRLCEKGDPVEPPKPVEHGSPPKPDKCLMKRAKELMQFWPNYPAKYADITVQIRVIETGVVYSFTDGFETSNPDMGQFAFKDPAVFDVLYNAQYGTGIELQFVSPRGEGGWQTCKYSPIAFDLTHQGSIKSIQKKVNIDITGDGTIDKLTQWFEPHAGILIDTTKDEKGYLKGAISGLHLMGDEGGKYGDGYDKLKEYQHGDIKDDYIEGKELLGLALWIDKNSNAKLDKGELAQLADYGIVQIPVLHDKNHEAHAVLADGGLMLMKDLWLMGKDRRLDA